jgi:hypothetical protein
MDQCHRPHAALRRFLNANARGRQPAETVGTPSKSHGCWLTEGKASAAVGWCLKATCGSNAEIRDADHSKNICRVGRIAIARRWQNSRQWRI